MKIADVTDEAIMEFCGIYDDDGSKLIPIAKDAAIAHIKAITGLTQEEIDSHEDITMAYLVLINDGFYNRYYTLSWQKQVNPYVDRILNAHRKNYV